MEREMGPLSQLGLGDFGAACESLSPLLLADTSTVDQLFEKPVRRLCSSLRSGGGRRFQAEPRRGKDWGPVDLAPYWGRAPQGLGRGGQGLRHTQHWALSRQRHLALGQADPQRRRP